MSIDQINVKKTAKLSHDDETGADLQENLVEDFDIQSEKSTRVSNSSSMVTIYDEEQELGLKSADLSLRYEFANFHSQHWEYWNLERMQRYRKFIAISLTSFIAIPVMFHGPIMIFQYATQWGIQMCLYQHALGYMAAKRPDSYRWRAAACIMQQLSICFNYTTCFVFWAVVAPEFFPVIPELWYRIGLAFAHVVPIFFSLVHYYLNDNTMYIGDWWHTFVVATVYCILNWFFTETSGVPVYPFLPWENGMSVFWCTFCTFVGIGCYWGTVMLTNKQRGRPLCAGKEDIACFSQELKLEQGETESIQAQENDI